MFYTYILYSKEYDRFYIGQTNNIKNRFLLHNNGRVKSTKRYILWELAWYKEYKSRSEAMDRERKLKNLKSHKRLVAFMSKCGTINPNGSSEFLQKIREFS